jgi:hypothetical protein
MTDLATGRARTNPVPSHGFLSPNDQRDLSRILSRLGEIRERPVRTEPHLVADNGPGQFNAPLSKARQMFAVRQRRCGFFPRSIFGEPGWDILLALYIHDSHIRLSITQLGQLVDTPATTVLRWLTYLEGEELILIRKHGHDRRTSMLQLTENGRSRMASFFQDVL